MVDDNALTVVAKARALRRAQAEALREAGEMERLNPN